MTRAPPPEGSEFSPGDGPQWPRAAIIQGGGVLDAPRRPLRVVALRARVDSIGRRPPARRPGLRPQPDGPIRRNPGESTPFPR